MSDINEMGSAQPNDAVSGGQGGSQQAVSGVVDEQQTKGSSRLIGEVKSLKQQLQDAKALSDSLELQKLEVEGNKDKMIEHLTNKVGTLEASNQSREKTIAFNTLGGQVKTEAAKMGCQDPADLVKLMDLKGIPVDPHTYEGDIDSIRILLQEEKSKRPFFFGKAAPTVHDVAQQNAVIQQNEVDFSKMSRDELGAYIKANSNKF